MSEAAPQLADAAVTGQHPMDIDVPPPTQTQNPFAERNGLLSMPPTLIPDSTFRVSGLHRSSLNGQSPQSMGNWLAAQARRERSLVDSTRRPNLIEGRAAADSAPIFPPRARQFPTLSVLRAPPTARPTSRAIPHFPPSLTPSNRVARSNTAATRTATTTTTITGERWIQPSRVFSSHTRESDSSPRRWHLIRPMSLSPNSLEFTSLFRCRHADHPEDSDMAIDPFSTKHSHIPLDIPECNFESWLVMKRCSGNRAELKSQMQCLREESRKLFPQFVPKRTIKKEVSSSPSDSSSPSPAYPLAVPNGSTAPADVGSASVVISLMDVTGATGATGVTEASRDVINLLDSSDDDDDDTAPDTHANHSTSSTRGSRSLRPLPSRRRKDDTPKESSAFTPSDNRPTLTGRPIGGGCAPDEIDGAVDLVALVRASKHPYVSPGGFLNKLPVSLQGILMSYLTGHDPLFAFAMFRSMRSGLSRFEIDRACVKHEVSRDYSKSLFLQRYRQALFDAYWNRKKREKLKRVLSGVYEEDLDGFRNREQDRLRKRKRRRCNDGSVEEC